MSIKENDFTDMKVTVSKRVYRPKEQTVLNVVNMEVDREFENRGHYRR
jgi:hypothetical protein